MSTNDETPKNPLRFRTFEDCLTEQPKDWLIEGALAFREDSTFFGPPGSLKSALLTDIAVHVATGRDWRGHPFSRGVDTDDDPEDAKINESRGVVYFALERAGLTRRRLSAYAKRDNLPADLPIAVVDELINLLDPVCVDQVADTIQQFEIDARCCVGLVIFDTFAKAIAAGMGDEDKALHQNMAAANLKRIRERCYGKFHIATIGHSGKNPAAGERGSNARLGHVDLAVQISGDPVRTAKVVKGNDQPEGDLASFEMEEVTLIRPGLVVPGRGRGGADLVIPPEPWKVAILAASTPAAAPRTAVSRPPTGKHTQALDALKRAIAERGQGGAVHADYWKEELTKAGRIKPNDSNPRATFKRIRDALSQQIIEVDGLVRIIPQPGQLPPPPPVSVASCSSKPL